MKVLTTWLLVACMASLSSMAWADAEELLGSWITPEDKAVIEIYEQNGAYYGKFISLKEPLYAEGHESGLAGQAKVDRNNPDASKHNDPIIGLNLLRGFTYKGDHTWHKGRIYDPENGKDYKCTIKLQKDGTLKVRGFVGISLFGRTQIWRPHN